jgi:hypothetical protein
MLAGDAVSAFSFRADTRGHPAAAGQARRCAPDQRYRRDHWATRILAEATATTVVILRWTGGLLPRADHAR